MDDKSLSEQAESLKVLFNLWKQGENSPYYTSQLEKEIDNLLNKVEPFVKVDKKINKAIEKIETFNNTFASLVKVLTNKSADESDIKFYGEIAKRSLTKFQKAIEELKNVKNSTQNNELQNTN